MTGKPGRWWIVFITVVVQVVVFTVGAGSAAEKPSREEVHIYSNEAVLDLDRKTCSIPGDVTVKMKDITMTGAGLECDEAKHLLSITKGPIRIEYGNDTVMTVEKMYADLDRRVVEGSGGFTLLWKSRSGSATGVAESVRVDTENGKAAISGNVRVEYRSLKPATSKEKESGLPGLKSDTVTATMERMTYDMRAETLEATSPVRVEIEDGWLRTKGLRGDLKKRTLEADGGVEAKIRDVEFRSDRMTVDDTAKRVVFEGKIRAERGDSVFTASRIEMGYGSGKRFMHLAGPNDLKMMIEKKKKDTKEGAPGEEKGAPEGK